jgi:hypothetical protein
MAFRRSGPDATSRPYTFRIWVSGVRAGAVRLEEREILWSKRQHFLLLAKSWGNNSTSALKRRVASDSTVTLSRDGYATLLGELMRPHVSINPEYDRSFLRC